MSEVNSLQLGVCRLQEASVFLPVVLTESVFIVWKIRSQQIPDPAGHNGRDEPNLALWFGGCCGLFCKRIIHCFPYDRDLFLHLFSCVILKENSTEDSSCSQHP